MIGLYLKVIGWPDLLLSLFMGNYRSTISWQAELHISCLINNSITLRKGVNAFSTKGSANTSDTVISHHTYPKILKNQFNYLMRCEIK